MEIFRVAMDRSVIVCITPISWENMALRLQYGQEFSQSVGTVSGDTPSASSLMYTSSFF